MEIKQKEISRKQATILHSDITGFDKLSEQLQPEEVTRHLNTCFQLMESIISLYGGIVQKISGDEMIAVFGVSDFSENIPAKAINAAFELIDKFEDINTDNELPIPVSIKMGIQTGSVLLGKFGTKDKLRETVLGDTVTIASRICDMAENRQILIGKETYDATTDKFDFLVLEPVPIKGRREPLPIFEVKEKKRAPVKTGVKQSRSINSAMVGRGKENRQLEKQVMQLINGLGSVVNIVGKAGIGKSRLMAEIKQNDILEKVAIFEGRALSNGHNLSFHPIIQIIKSWAGIKEEDSSEKAIRKLESNIRKIYPEAFDEIFPFIATMMGYRLEGIAKERLKDIKGEALENLILKNMRDLLSRASSIRPIMIVIEDAHWCDISSVIFMESLFKLVQTQRILFVNVLRPEYKETGERISKFLGENLPDHVLEISVESLTKKESDELINNLLLKVELPDKINSLIIERAGGNPFFIEEVIRSFIDEGLIIIKDNSFIFTENIKYANIPESIDNIILSRIDRLDGKTKDLLRTASVIGRNFYFKVLEEAAQTIEEVDNKLEYLKDVQLLNERKQKDEVEFLFKHALAQQATYESIVEKTRKDLHLKIATSIEKVFAGRIHEFYGTLSHHYSKAGQLEKTEEYLIKAGEECMKSGASSEAVAFLKKALDNYIQQNLIPDPQKVIDLEEKLCWAYYATGQHIEAVKYFDRVITFYDRPFPKSGLLRMLGFLYNLSLIYKIMYFYKYSPEARSNDIDRKLMKISTTKNQALTNIDPKRVFFESFEILRFIRKKHLGNFETTLVLSGASTLFFTGILFNLGQRIVAWGGKYADEKNVIGWLWAKHTQMICAYYSGVKINIEEEEKVIKLGTQIGEYWSTAIFYLYGGFVMIEQGNQKQTIHYLKRSSEVSKAFENNYTLSQYHRLNITYKLKFRKLAEMLKSTDEAFDFVVKTDYTIVLFVIYCSRSMAYCFQSKIAEARANLAEAKKLVNVVKIPIVITHYLIADCYIQIMEFKIKVTENPNIKNMLKTTKLLIKQSDKARFNYTEAYRLQAIVYQISNKPNKAILNFEKSINAGLKSGVNLELSRTYFEAGKFLRDPNNKKDRINGLNGTECLLKAKSMFEEMNLEWDLKEYENYMNGK